MVRAFLSLAGHRMISYFRHLFVDSWLGRAFALLIFAAFVLWGVGDFFSSMGRNDAGTVASVGAQKVSAQEFDSAYRQQLGRVAQQTGGDASQIPAGERGQIAMQVLQGLVSHAEALREATRLGVVVPDAVLRQTIFDLPIFKGENQQFDRAKFDQWLAGHNLTEQRLLSLVREDLAANALIEPLRAGATAPAIVVRRAYDYGAQTRTLDMVRVPFAAMATPPAADDATLRRYYDNHRGQFQAPEYRRIKLVLLSPATVARTLDVPEAEERALFKAQAGTGAVPEKRSVQVITAPTEARAQALATLWNGGAGWPQMQAAAADSVPVALDDATEATFPDPALGRLAFAAKPDQVSPPAHLASGWVLLKVVRVVAPATRSFESMRPALHDEIAASRSRDGMSDRVQKLQDAIAGGSGLDQIPADLGAAAAEGTLDAKGLTQAGEPAPLPGNPAQRKAILAQAFAQKQGDPPALKQGPDDSEFALIVEAVAPARAQDYAAVQERVRAAVQHDAVRRAAEQQAASLYALARARGGLARTGRADLVHVGPVGRGAAPQGVPAELARAAFSLLPGSSTMVETPKGFAVGTVTGIQHPEPSANRLAYDRLQTTLDGAYADDIETSYSMALREKTKPVLNAQAIRSVVGQ
jgi:peptidyl-prolyl cis-trans isomerase D